MSSDFIMLICVLCCILCPIVAVTTIVISSYNINKKIHIIEVEFFKLYKDSEGRIDRTNEMVCQLSSAINNITSVQNTTTTEYARQIDKLQQARDAAVAQSINILQQNAEISRQNTILSQAATAPHTNINVKN